MPKDTRALTENEKAAIRRIYEQQVGERWREQPVTTRLAYEQELVESVFIAGLRYRDGAEPSEAEVEAAAKALSYLDEDDWMKWWRRVARIALSARKASP